MTIAFVTDCLNDYISKQIDRVSQIDVVCIFLPAAYQINSTKYVPIRRFEADCSEATFQRYDLVVYCSEFGWNQIIPIIHEVKGVAIIKKEAAYYEEISKWTAYQLSPDMDYPSILSELPKHIHWFDREINDVINRLEAFGLLTEKVKADFEKNYTVPLSKEWLSGETIQNDCNKTETMQNVRQ